MAFFQYSWEHETWFNLFLIIYVQRFFSSLRLAPQTNLCKKSAQIRPTLYFLGHYQVSSFFKWTLPKVSQKISIFFNKYILPLYALVRHFRMREWICSFRPLYICKEHKNVRWCKNAYRKIKTCKSCGHLFYIFCWHRHAQLDPKDLQTSDRWKLNAFSSSPSSQ